MTYITQYGDYDEMYGGLDYKGAIVLDIGADYGTTAKYFLEQGASRVIVSERKREWVVGLEWLAERDSRVTVVPPLSAENAARILSVHRPDVVKVDCEGCERFLLEVPFRQLLIPRAWVIETHTRVLLDQLRDLFQFLRYEVTLIKDYGPMKTNPDKYVAVFQVVRDNWHRSAAAPRSEVEQAIRETEKSGRSLTGEEKS